MAIYKPHVLSQKTVQRVRMRLVLRVLYIYTYTGIWAEPSHPYLRSYRFCFSSSAPTRTIVGSHVPFNPKPTRSIP